MTPDQTADLYNNLDLVWIPVAWFAVHPHQRAKTVALVVTCLLTLRTQAQLIEWTGYENGFLPWFHSPARTRGMVTYAVIIALFLLLAHFSPRTKSIVFFAVALTVYIFAFCVSMVVMAI